MDGAGARTALIFDFDGTVCDTEEPVFRAWSEIYARSGCELTVQGKRALNDAAPIRPGVEAWLDRAAALGVPVGLASSSPLSWVEANLGRLGLSDRFATAVCFGPQVPPKPDPTSFREACVRLGALPADSVAVEDSPHGVRAARDAGLFTVGVPHRLSPRGGLVAAGADLVVDSLADLGLDDVLEQVRAQRA